MPHSMTGFASVESSAAPFQLSWELRSINHRFLDLTFRLPEDFRRLEADYRKLVGSVVRRGKVDCVLKITLAKTETDRWELDADAMERLKALQAELRASFSDAAPLSVAELLRFPGVVKDVEPAAAQLEAPVRRLLDRGLEALQRLRDAEGLRLAAALEQRNEAITTLLDELRPLLANAQDRLRDKLMERIRRLDVEVHPERLEQELALIAQRLDVTEEADRLESHVTQIRTLLQAAEPIGRRLDFLIQELNREANTLASKAQDEQMTRIAVELKVLIEQMREQVQNLE
jgi:uncharacterized protein (TIGR00255 family)